jgi:hypothetical protein
LKILEVQLCGPANFEHPVACFGPSQFMWATDNSFREFFADQISVYSCLPRLEIFFQRHHKRFDKGKAVQSQRRKATGPRFLRDAFCYASKDPKIAGLPKP